MRHDLAVTGPAAPARGDPAWLARRELRARGLGQDLAIALVGGEQAVVGPLGGHAATVELSDPAPHEDAISCDAASRLLLLWGREPADPSRIRTSLPIADYQAARTILAGY